jgi:hypothetical protein
MTKDQGMAPARGTISFWLLLLNAVVLKTGFTVDEKLYWLLAITIPLQLIALTGFLGKAAKQRQKEKTGTMIHNRVLENRETAIQL